MPVQPDVVEESVPPDDCLRKRFRTKTKPYSSCLKARVIGKEMHPPEVSIAIEVVCQIALIGPY